MRVVNVLSGIAASAAKMSNDIRLLQHLKEVEEPFEKTQIGSSAMAYKRNPMRSERMASLADYVMSDMMNPMLVASTQWFERTLDDSANKRLSIPEGFLAVDGILRLMANVSDGLHVNEKIIAKTVSEYLPFIATENLLMSAVKAGGDRQQMHEIIRRHSMDATLRMREGLSCNLLEELGNDPDFVLSSEAIAGVLNAADYIGRCPEQVDRYLATLPKTGGTEAEEISL